MVGGGSEGERNPRPNPLLVLTTLVFARRLRRPIDAGVVDRFWQSAHPRPVGRPPRVQKHARTAALYCYCGHQAWLLSLRKWSLRIQGRSCEFFAPTTTDRSADKRGCKYPLWDAGLIASRRVGRVGVVPGLGQRSTSGPLMYPRCRLNPPSFLTITLHAKSFSLSFARFHFYSRLWWRDIWVGLLTSQYEQSNFPALKSSYHFVLY